MSEIDLQNQLRLLEEKFRRHNHDGIETDELDFQAEIDAIAALMPYSFPVPGRLADTSTMIYTDSINDIPSYENANNRLEFASRTYGHQRRDTTSDWAAINNIWGAAKLGDYVYALLQDTDAAPDEWRIYRFTAADLSAGGTQMTFSGTAPDLTVDVNLRFACDGTDFYINYDGGNSANAYVLAKYTVSGTVFTYDSSITCGAATLGFNSSFAVLSDGTIYTVDPTNDNMSKFNSAGTLVYTDDTTTINEVADHLSNVMNTLYACNSLTDQYQKQYYT